MLKSTKNNKVNRMRLLLYGALLLIAVSCGYFLLKVGVNLRIREIFLTITRYGTCYGVGVSWGLLNHELLSGMVS